MSYRWEFKGVFKGEKAWERAWHFIRTLRRIAFE